MLEILSARNTQSTVSGINYRKYLHQWICLPDIQMYVQARKVNEQLSDVSMTGVSYCRQVSSKRRVKFFYLGLLRSSTRMT